MRRDHLVFPTPKDIGMALNALRLIPTEEKTKIGWRYSHTGVPNLRVTNVTRKQKWLVDIYSGGYYCVRVGSTSTEICKSTLSLVGYLCRRLGVRPKMGVSD